MENEHTEIKLWDALKATRQEKGGIPLKRIAKIMKDVFDEAELKSLITSLTPLTTKEVYLR